MDATGRNVTTDDDELISEQVAYYRARAPEYDDWFLRRGRYDQGPDHSKRWVAEIDMLLAELDRVEWGESVLEFAPGTGWWTAELANRVESVMAVDSAPEVLTLNQDRVGSRNVEYVQADIFDWGPGRRYDAVFFSFWLSHVPPSRFEEFWSLVGRCVRPGGTVFFIDTQRHAEYQWSDGKRVGNAPGSRDHRVTRELSDGRRFDIVKVFYHPRELLARLEELGWEGEVSETPEFFLWGKVHHSRTN